MPSGTAVCLMEKNRPRRSTGACSPSTMAAAGLVSPYAAPMAIAAGSSIHVPPIATATRPRPAAAIAHWLVRTGPIPATRPPATRREVIAQREHRPTSGRTRAAGGRSRGATSGASTEGTVSATVTRSWAPRVTASASSGRPPAPRSDLSEANVTDRVVGALAQDDVGAFARRQDVLEQVAQVDAGPDVVGHFARLRVAQVPVMVEVGGGILEDARLQRQEAVDVPGLDVLDGRIDVDGEVEEVRDDHRR